MYQVVNMIISPVKLAILIWGSMGTDFGASLKWRLEELQSLVLYWLHFLAPEVATGGEVIISALTHDGDNVLQTTLVLNLLL